MFENWDTLAWVTTILASLAIIVPSVLWFLDRRRQAKRDEESRKEKRLGFRVDYAQSLVSLNPNVDESEVEVFFRGTQLVEPEIMGVTFQNVGQVPIIKDDFSEPLKLIFGERAEIVSVDVEDKKPDDLPVAFKVEGTEIDIEKLLLNAGDSFSLKVLGTKVSEFSTSARIRDVVELENINEAMEEAERERIERLRKYPRWDESTLAVLIGAFIIFTGVVLHSAFGNREVTIALGVGGVSGIILITVEMGIARLMRKR